MVWLSDLSFNICILYKDCRILLPRHQLHWLLLFKTMNTLAVDFLIWEYELNKYEKEEQLIGFALFADIRSNH